MAADKLDLVGVFERQCEPELRRQLARAKAPEEAGRAVGLALAPLLDPQGDAIGNLPRQQALAVRALLSVAMEGCELLRRGCSSQDAQLASDPAAPSMALLLSIACSATAAALTTKAVSWAMSPVIGVPAGLIAGVAASKIPAAAPPAAVEATVTVVEPQQIVATVKEVLTQAQSFAEKTLLMPPPKEKGLHEHEALMELLQSLLAADENDLHVLSTEGTGNLTRFLRRHDIVAVSYDRARDGALPDPDRWTVETAPPGTASRTLAPLLCHEGVVIRRGRVLLEAPAP